MVGKARPPYVLVHGFADTAQTWDPLIAFLTDSDVHVWDLPGHGERSSSSDPMPLDRDETVRELVNKISALGAPVTLVGHSLGGYLALMTTIENPDLVASIALISSGPGFRNATARSEWNDYIDSIAASTSMSRESTEIAYQPDSYVIDNLAAIDAPLVHIIGSRDRRYRAGADYLQKILPKSNLFEIEGAGHHPQRTHPAEVAKYIVESRQSLLDAGGN